MWKGQGGKSGMKITAWAQEHFQFTVTMFTKRQSKALSCKEEARVDKIQVLEYER